MPRLRVAATSSASIASKNGLLRLKIPVQTAKNPSIKLSRRLRRSKCRTKASLRTVQKWISAGAIFVINWIHLPKSTSIVVSAMKLVILSVSNSMDILPLIVVIWKMTTIIAGTVRKI